MTVSLIETAWLVPLYPLVGALASLLWSPGLIARTGPRPSGYINLLMVAIAFGHSFLALLGLNGNSAAGAAALYAPPSFSWTWLNTAGLRIGLHGLVPEPALHLSPITNRTYLGRESFNIPLIDAHY